MTRMKKPISFLLTVLMLARNDSTATLGAALYNYGVAAKACFTA